MNRKMSKRQKDIKSKLMAAISMLLVSSIMMVSSTYAWFTLSTAPEVKGISTAVGANGNLEMALMPLSGKTEDITSNQGDSMNAQDKTLANVTWGNLVDLKNAYGLEGITLYPSALNVDETSGNISTGFPVSIPKYGVDGRVTELDATAAVPGYYTAGSFLDAAVDAEGEPIDNPRGVRAIGVASGASPAQLAYKAAIMAASQAATNAQNKASGALISKGGALADIAIRHVNGKDDSFTADDIANLQAMLTAVYGTEENPGSLLIIQNALKEYMVANYISGHPDAYEVTADTIRGLTTLDASANYVPEAMKTMIGKLNTAIGNAQAAQAAMPSGDGPFSWGDIRDVVEKLANPSMMNLNSFAIDELEDNISQLFTDVTSGKGINLYLQSGAGVFVDIADFCGDYLAPVVIPRIQYGSYDLPNVSVTMHTQSDIEPPYLTQAKNAMPGAPSNSGGSDVNPLSDFYGYIIDLAFRTNVAGSNLELRTVGVDRIYSDSTTNEATMGGGSTMVFKSADPNFTAARMIELMGHLKVVLFDPSNGKIVKNLVITNDPTQITTAEDGTVTAPLYVAAADGVNIATKQKMDATNTPVTDTDGNPVMEADPTIMALDQNTIVQLSALVYLDGTTLTNADVANAAQSMAGSLNLQFGSSANLVPMEYADLRNGTVDAPTDTPLPVVNDVTKGTISAGYTIAQLKHVAIGDTYKLVAIINDTTNNTAVTGGATVTIGGTEATYTTVGSYSGWVVDGTAEVPTAAVNVTVAPTT